jgi:hypothetical protein
MTRHDKLVAVRTSFGLVNRAVLEACRTVSKHSYFSI